MEKKYNKQKRNIIIKITSVLLIVWLVVSAVFCTITLTAEKQTQITKSHNDYNYLVSTTTEIAQPYNEMCKYIQVTKERLVDYTRELIKEDEITCGADGGTYDKNIQVVLYEFPVFTDDESSPVENKIIMDTDKEIFFPFLPEDYSDYTGNNGILNYDEFVSSTTPEQLESIRQYLNTPIDENGYFYLLINKYCYYNPENGHVYPKTVEIVKAYNDSNGYGVEETVESFDLNPIFTGGAELYKSSQNEPTIIDGEFVCNNFASIGLIDDPFESLNLETYDPNTGIIEKNGLFTYHILEGGTYSISTIDFEGGELAYAYHNEQRELLDSAEVLGYVEDGDKVIVPDNPVQYVVKNVGIRYAKRINLLECCGDTLIIGIASIFLFFLIIGVILIIMMCKVLKTQIEEEEKRREITNALAHDIKTPLFIISGYAQNLKENVNTDKREHYCDRIIDRTKEVNELVHKMLDFSKLDTIEQALNIENVDMTELLSLAIEDYSTLPDKKVFNTNINDNCVINADRAFISRAISYLLENAVKYSESNTSIDIMLNKDSLSISNKCRDITVEDISHLVEPYFRVEKNRESKGNGLGLSIVKSIVDMHDFKLDIKLNDDIITFKIVFHN